MTGERFSTDDTGAIQHGTEKGGERGRDSSWFLGVRQCLFASVFERERGREDAEKESLSVC